MASSEGAGALRQPAHGQIGYVQLPAIDIVESATFYRAVFGWAVEDTGGFEGAGIIGQLTTEIRPAEIGGPAIWLCVDGLATALDAVVSHGGVVQDLPQLDHGERWLATVADPAGNRIGLVAPRLAPQSQTMIAVADVEASSRWYQQLLGLTSAHGGSEYERLLSDGALVLQLHHHGTDHHHGSFRDADVAVGNGVLLWFGEVSDFDAVVDRADQLGAPVVRAPNRNPPEGDGNGPSHRELWISDPDGYTVVVASPDGEAFEQVS